MHPIQQDEPEHDFHAVLSAPRIHGIIATIIGMNLRLLLHRCRGCDGRCRSRFKDMYQLLKVEDGPCVKDFQLMARVLWNDDVYINNLFVFYTVMNSLKPTFESTFCCHH